MSEENKNVRIALSDDELEQVTGGRANFPRGKDRKGHKVYAKATMNVAGLQENNNVISQAAEVTENLGNF